MAYTNGWPTTWVGTNMTVTTTMSSTANVVWNNWNTTATTMTTVQYPVTSERQRAELAEYEARRAEQREATRVRLEAAQERAMETLRTILTRDELAGLDTDGELIVTGSDGQRYLIGMYGVAGNVVRLDEHGCRLESYCCHPNMGWLETRMPNADGWIAQVLAIRACVDYFLGKANVSNRSRQCHAPMVPAGVPIEANLMRNPIFEVVGS